MTFGDMSVAELNIRPAREEEAALLTDLAMRAKAYWGYDEAFMNACLGELTVTEEAIRNEPIWVAAIGFRAAGFYKLKPLTRERVELDALYVDPSVIGEGVGRVLMIHAVRRAKESGFKAMEIQADPNSEGFYVHFGAARIGEKASLSIEGRQLPLLELALKAP